MKISKVPMVLTEGEPPWYHQMYLEDGKLAERWVQYEEGDMPEEEPEEMEEGEEGEEETNEPNIIYKSNCPSLFTPWYFCVKCNKRLGLDNIYCPGCGEKKNWENIKEG